MNLILFMDLFSKDIRNIINKYRIQLSDDLFNVVCQIDNLNIIFYVGGKTIIIDPIYSDSYLSQYISVHNLEIDNTYTLDKFLSIDGFYFHFSEQSGSIFPYKLYKTDKVRKYCLFLKDILSQYK
jgi:hypothetical protein